MSQKPKLRNMEQNNPYMKYTIPLYMNKHLKDELVKRLGYNIGSYYRKVKTKVGEFGGFEYCEMLQIASLLNRPVESLITNEAREYYSKQYNTEK